MRSYLAVTAAARGLTRHTPPLLFRLLLLPQASEPSLASEDPVGEILVPLVPPHTHTHTYTCEEPTLPTISANAPAFSAKSLVRRRAS